VRGGGGYSRHGESGSQLRRALGESKWCGNGLRFGTREEAEAYVRDLARRRTAVVETRVVESEEAPNSEILGRKTEVRA
jgi:hypothetical protein